MKQIGLIIFIIGVFIDIGAFLLSNADQFNFVYSIVSPSYLKGISAIRIMENKGEIKPGTPEFEICNNLYTESIKRDYPDYDLSGFTIERFHHPPSIVQGLSIKRGVNVRRPLNVYLSNGAIYESTIEALQIKIDRLKKSKIIGSSTLMFVTGTVLTLLGFSLAYVKSKNA